MRLALASILLALAACGGGDDTAAPDAERVPDAEPGIDAEVPDAMPAPDAMITADLGCAGDSLPTMGSDPIVITGHSYSASTGGQADLDGAVAEAYATGSATVLDSDTSAGGGVYTLTIANGAMAVIDGYVKGTAATYLDAYLYPPFPLAADTDQAPLLFITQSTLGLLGFVSGASQDSAKGFVGILVVDCAGNPVEGATVSVSPTTSSPTIVYVGTNNVPNTTLTHTSAAGLAFVFNTVAGDVTVDADVGGTSLREHVINARAGAITTTAVAAGPITPAP